MNRKLVVMLSALAVVLALTLARVPAASAQSSGCSAFAGLVGGFLQEFSSKDTGVQPFNAGETIQIVATIDGTSTPFPDITWYVTGNTGGTITQSGSALSFTIPTTQNYRIVVESTFGVDANIAASCGGGSAPQWSGFSDGRLSPDPAEDFSIFCGPGYVDVYTSFQGQGSLLARISQFDLRVLNIGQNRQVQTAGSPLIVLRVSQTVYRFSGNNGNRAPEFGQKEVDLAPCGLDLTIPPTPRPAPTADLDPDRDGVLGRDDLCPMFSYIASRYKLYGCRDTDGDGYVNPYNFDGVTYVLDNSNPNTGIYIDDCPQVFGQGINGNGCPDVVTSTTTVNTTLNVDLSTQPQSVANALLGTGNTYGTWQSVTLQAQEDDCALPPEEINTNTTNYLVVAICEGPEE